MDPEDENAYDLEDGAPGVDVEREDEEDEEKEEEKKETHSKSTINVLEFEEYKYVACCCCFFTEHDTKKRLNCVLCQVVLQRRPSNFNTL